MRMIVIAASGLFAAAFALPSLAADWLQFGFDAAHSGVNPGERLLTKRNVQNLFPLYSTTLPGTAEGAPVLLSGVATANGTKDVLYITLNNGTLLALDAGTGTSLWSRFPGVPANCFDEISGKPCVTASSPALDPNRQFVYNYALDGFVHKYKVDDGTETTGGGWPQMVTAKPNFEQVSSALSIATAHNGTTYLYVVTSGASWVAEDGGDYQGHVTAINLGTGAQITFNAVCATQGNIHFVANAPNPPVSVTPDCVQQTVASGTNVGNPTGDAGIWGRAGAVYDSVSDRIYVSTGNGIFYDSTTIHPYLGTDNWGDSVLTLPAAMDSELLAPLDSYTPSAYDSYMTNDTDLGSTSIVLAPAPAGSSKTHIGIQSGKDGYLRILDLDNLSSAAVAGPGNTGGEVFVGNVPQTNEVKTQPLIWTDPGSSLAYVIVVNNFGISAVQLYADASNGNAPALHYQTPFWMNTGTSAPSSTTTGGTSPVLANNVLYYAGGSGLQALDPATGNVLWSNTAMGTANAVTSSSFHKQSLIVLDNRLYAFDKHGMLWVYQGDEIFLDDFQG